MKRDWKAMTERVIAATKGGDAAEAAVEIVSGFFEIPSDVKTKKSTGEMAEIAIRSAAGKYAAVERNARAKGSSQRTLWRYLRVLALPDFHRELRSLWNILFRIAVARYGFGRRGYDICIDEFQTHFFGQSRYDIDGRDDDVRHAHPDDEDLTEVGLVAGASKDDKYSGKFHALTYQAIVARCRTSGVVLPLDIVLVATEHPFLVGDLKVHGRSRVEIMKHFVGILNQYRETPRIILFDRGYHANENYAEVGNFCKQRRTRYMTPAPDEAGKVHYQGKTYDRIRTLCKEGFHTSKPLPGGERYLVAQRPVKNSPDTLRTLLVVYHPRKKRRQADLPPGAVEVAENYWAAPFYISEPDPEPAIRWWVWIYSLRWCEENWFKARSTNYHDGRAHKVQRRMFVLMVGIICLALYAVLRIQRHPVLDIRVVSRYYNVADYTDRLLIQLEAG